MITAGEVRAATAQKVSLCELNTDPATYDHRLVEVTGFVAHGFEDFSLFDPTCPPRFGIWLEYGGTVASGTVYCCGQDAQRSRPKPLEVENLSIPLVTDRVFRAFDDLIQGHDRILLHATLVGRFFAGSPHPHRAEELSRGYGHLGCCSLLAIERIRSVDTAGGRELDDDPDPDTPNVDGVGCGYRELTGWHEDRWIQAQREAEDRQPWAFDDPRRVASEALDGSVVVPAGTALAEIRRVKGRVVYKTEAPVSGSDYTVVVSRPYLVSFYARDSARVAWLAIAIYGSRCDPPTAAVEPNTEQR